MQQVQFNFTISKFVLLVGVILIILAALGVDFLPGDALALGVATCFASFLV